MAKSDVELMELAAKAARNNFEKENRSDRSSWAMASVH